MIIHQLDTTSHPIFWWYIKVICGLVLIAGIFVRYLVDSIPPLFAYPDYIGQGLVIIGGTMVLYHYLLLKKNNPSIFKPNKLITDKGLFKYVRHPMYFANIVMYLGFVLLMPHLITIAIFVVAVAALYKQAKVEDLFMAQLFKSEHQEWTRTTRLIFPGVS